MSSKRPRHGFLNSFLGLILLAGLVYLGWWFYNYQVKEVLKEKPLPTFQEIEKKIITPEPLTGPRRETRASELKPELILRWTNFHRQENNVSELSQNTLLDNAATAKVNDMFEKQYFDHIGPDGLDASHWVQEAGYQYIVIGENLALGDFQNEKELVDAWMASEGHRENILKPAFTEIGVAAKLGNFQGRQTFLAVQMFGAPASLCKTPDKSLEKAIRNKKAQYESLGEIAEEIKKLIKESNELMKKGNEKVKQGNQAETKEEAEELWAEGKALQEQAREKFDEAKELQKELEDAEDLYEEIKTLTNKYNQQIEEYNDCLESYSK